MPNEDPFDEALVQAIVEEAKRRGLKATATCQYCGEVFLKQEVGYIVEHTKVCEGRDKDV